MGMILSSDYSWVECDEPGCNNKSRKVREQRETEREAERDGWRISHVNRHATCPECWAKEHRKFYS